jgi:hypothetical protein
MVLAILDAVIASAPAKGIVFTTSHQSRRIDMSQRSRASGGGDHVSRCGNFECLALAPALPEA